MTPRDQRNYVLDTNVLLYDPQALFSFAEHDVIIPMAVIEEVDRFKKDVNETGRNARTISRYLDALRRQGSLKAGVTLDQGGRLRVDYEQDVEAITWGPNTADNLILATAIRYAKERKGATLVTRDTNMRLKADALGIEADDYQNAHIEVDEQYTGMVEIRVAESAIDELYANGSLGLAGFDKQPPHAFLLMVAEENPSKTAMARVDPRRDRVRLVGRHREGVWGIFARNKEQLFALDLLLDDSVQLVTLNGVAGTGKTLLAIAAGLKQVADDQRYRKMLVSRPIFPLGRDIGFLVGYL